MVVTRKTHTKLILSADAGPRWSDYGRMMQLVQGLRRDVRRHVWDYALAGAMVGIALVALATRIDVEAADAFRYRADTWWSWVLTIGVCASLVGRRRWPLRSLAVGLILTLPLELGHRRDSVAFFAIVIALYSVATQLPLRLAWRGPAMVVALYATMIATNAMVLTSAPLVGNFMLAAGFILGHLLQRSRVRQQRDVDTAIARRVEEVEATDLAAARERLRLAQDLHDVVAHSLSVIAVQAGIGAHLIDRQPGEATRALEAIRATTRAAEGELTHLVDVLRGGGGVTDTGAAPELAGVSALVEQIRSAGVPVDLTIEGDLTSVPAGVSLAAYRIVQEALTNVVRHAGRAHAFVAVHATDRGVRLRIDDDGRGDTAERDMTPGQHDGGNGLIGMNERALMYGGEVHTGPRPGGGFRVQATLPFSSGTDTPIGSSEDSSFRPVENGGPATEDLSPIARRARAVRTGWAVPRWLFDVAMVAIMIGLVTLEIVNADPANSSPHYTPTRGWAWLLRIGCCLPLATRRRFPTMSLAVTWVLGLALTFGEYQVGIIVFILWIGLYSVAGYGTTRRFVAATVGCWAGVLAVVLSNPPDLTNSGAVWLAIIFFGVAVVGYVVRHDRERRTAALAHQENAIDAQTRHALLVIATQRLRIADELNMIITRSIRTISSEAVGASALVETDPHAAERSLQTISSVSREALNDLRRLLKHMRNESEPAPYEPVSAAASARDGSDPADSEHTGSEHTGKVASEAL